MSRRTGKKRRRGTTAGRPESAATGRPRAPAGRRRAATILAGALVVSAGAFWWWRAPRTGSGGLEPTPAVAAVPAPAGEIRRQAGLNVLLVTVDTLRADALGSYGRAGAGTPWMDRLAREGVRFENAYAHNALTLPSHANILAGLYPHEHGVRDNSGFRFPGDVATLAEVLRQAGYRTGAFVSAFPLDSRFGLARGFEVYEDGFVGTASRPAFLEQERAGAETVALARQWLAAEDARPWFAWVHLYEPHFPYAPPEPLASRFAADPYQGEVAAADAALGPLLEPILAGGGVGTLVVLTSDHGESLGEHGEATHGIFAYEGVLKVPLILYQPALFGPRVVGGPARHVDLMPTILDALSLPAPAGLRGRSLLPAAAGRPGGAGVEVYFEALSGQLNRGWAPLYGVIDRGWKYVDLPIPELYDLASDPAESNNLAVSKPGRLAEARAILEALRSDDPGSVPSAESAEVRRRLAALGYLGGGGGAAARDYTSEDDPKNLIELDAALREVATRYQAGDLAGALRLCRELVRRRPSMRMALAHLAMLERDSGDLEAAVEAQWRAFALFPEDASALALLATYLTQAGREAEAVEVTEPHAGLAEPDVDVLLARGLALARLRRPREALQTLERAGAVDPSNPTVPVYLGTVYLMGGQREPARAAYERALALNPGTASAHSSLAIMAIEEGEVERSLAHWRQALAADSREHSKLARVGTGLWSAGRRAAARPLLELLVASAAPAEYGDELAAARRLLAAGG